MFRDRVDFPLLQLDTWSETTTTMVPMYINDHTGHTVHYSNLPDTPWGGHRELPAFVPPITPKTAHAMLHARKAINSELPSVPSRSLRVASSTLTLEGIEALRARGHLRNLEQRRIVLQSDPYVAIFETKRVLCKGCKKWLTLSKRRDYYPGNWTRHKEGCEKVRCLMNKADKKVERRRYTDSGAPVSFPTYDRSGWLDRLLNKESIHPTSRSARSIRDTEIYTAALVSYVSGPRTMPVVLLKTPSRHQTKDRARTIDER
ncbi:hypothetical protein CONPUDRAFT_73917 [Coniophora puteana RWD-64-598 SS2]|uniref:Uncharacterized protein n=1 Tax=Coniophora puteana (strain RWD-64-598) TaxID=741705 RepID=A0A5M3MKJ9_CONPW|nr:uncharacterized protein CONPUDRAFT_73917 [Coniophora puteana RWD-64-598 SS2]EIW79490.1 hypothetical protein CONPUDRAFT_73917 [Coniophora puteana RWD-64-598 SS2]